jgi:hypothetical protein
MVKEVFKYKLENIINPFHVTQLRIMLRYLRINLPRTTKSFIEMGNFKLKK